MSGGSRNYYYGKVCEWPLNELLANLLESIFHDFEWAESGDTSWSEAEQSFVHAIRQYLDSVGAGR